MKAFLCLVMMLTIIGCAVAAPEDMKGKKLTAETSVDDVLDAMDLAGRDLKGFDADVTLTEEDLVRTGQELKRSGKVWFQLLNEGSARVHILFDRTATNGRIREQKLEYLLEGGWLTERDYKAQKEVKRQVLKPGEKVNLLKLGEGPFPLPIGQKKEDVKKVFDVEKVPPAKDDPANTIHLKLTPKPDTSYARRFASMDVYVAADTHLPVRIATMDKNKAKLRTTDLNKLRLNPGLTDADFALPEIKGGEWNRVVEEYQE
jgi:hypothetical protein